MAEEPQEATPKITMVDSTLATLGEQAIVLIRLAVIIIGSLGAVIGFIKTKDLTSLILFFKGEQGAATIAAATTFGTIVLGLWRTYVKRRRTIVAGKAAPNKIVEVITK